MKIVDVVVTTLACCAVAVMAAKDFADRVRKSIDRRPVTMYWVNGRAVTRTQFEEVLRLQGFFDRCQTVADIEVCNKKAAKMWNRAVKRGERIEDIQC
ncbi:hypothetical protein [Sinimarinibacterium sp. NLF-5-8]|uniref:hypothetical protein n=1 Tax=Sinimarinibacterium sp. NLF-5-8 TaxID=2698684 RepID=UPI00137BC5A1|nr:hypothetical protein [Sinimarinibacterium sp. NLF-5-8]QHS09095.1 hypothetical protein GT972_02305 [Sinimarinibacterium sp. NLF-5-8]